MEQIIVAIVITIQWAHGASRKEQKMTKTRLATAKRKIHALRNILTANDRHWAPNIEATKM